jgi:hypothetical protein
MRDIFPEFSMLLITAALVTQPSLALAACETKSGNATTALIELYTSEGCNSCPPADRWLGELRQHGFGPTQVVPLALHVDYWNDLGWIDPFAQRLFTERQRDFARRTQASTVYTPEVVLNGREYRRWPWTDFRADLERINRQPPRAEISLRLAPSNRTLSIVAAVSTKEKPAAALYLALYENNLHTQVRAGENNGRRLAHEFVTRRLLGPYPLDRTGAVNVHETLTLDDAWKTADLGVAAFVQHLNDTEVLQALALDVCATPSPNSAPKKKSP